MTTKTSQPSAGGTTPSVYDGPPLRWTQFEHTTLEQLYAARAALAKASGMAGADKMTAWSLRALELAGHVRSLIDEIERNYKVVLQESISGPVPGVKP